MRVAVFCASANEVEPCYFREAGRLGKRIGELGWQLIYGGTNIGLMREVADATIRQGGEVTCGNMRMLLSLCPVVGGL